MINFSTRRLAVAACLVLTSVLPALAALPSPAALAMPLPQGGDLVELLGPRGPGAYANAAGDWPAYGYSRPIMGRNGGWCTAVETLSPVDGLPSYFAAGRLASDPDGPARILRLPQTISGIVQQTVVPIALDGSSLVYVSSEAPWMAGPASLWRDDQQLLEQGAIVANGTAEFYFYDRVAVRSNGTMLIHGVLREPGSIDWDDALVEWPSMEVQIKEGDTVPGVPTPIKLAEIFSPSPDGNRWAVVASFVPPGELNAKRVLLVDGEVYESEPGYPVIWDAPVSPRLASLGFTNKWSYVTLPQILNDGTVAFYGSGGEALQGTDWHIWVRNGTAVRVADPNFGLPLIAGLDPTGAVLSYRYPDQVPRIEGVPVLQVGSIMDVDINFDGVADAGYATQPQIHDLYGRPMASSETLIRTVMTDPSGGSGFVIVRARDFRIDEVYCNGVPNSTGQGASMLATGDRRAGSNEVTLRAYDLPLQSFGYFLASLTQGFDSNPGGSQGHLCLSGDVGRLQGQIFQSGTSGTAGAVLDLTSIPQPNGSAVVLAGQIWNFQTWYRDQVQGSATSNFTDAIAVEFE